MKCKNCGSENKDTAKYCSRCGKSLDIENNSNSNLKVIIAILIVVIIALALSFTYFMFNSNNNVNVIVPATDSGNTSVNSSVGNSTQSTSQISSDSSDWKLIGSYSGSGSGSQSISVPEGKIMVKLSAYPIKNYATNHLYVSGSNGISGGVDWGSTSAVATKSDSFSYTSSSSQVFTIDYYETVSWQVDFYRYQ